METWQVVLAVVMGLGTAVILLGGFWDRERRLRHQRAATLPPERPIPGLASDAAPPNYLDRASAMRTPEGAPSLALADPARAVLRSRIAASTAVEAGLLSDAFVTDPETGWAVADDALVVVCSERVDTVRELLAVLESAVSEERPLVVVAPQLLPEVRATLEVNQTRRTLRLIAVTADHERLYRLAELSGATPLERHDLQAGYAPAAALGGARTWVSSARQTWVLND
ncbi:hypothetical protein HJ590_16350 [Naumannella sp. ID2617S]|uniref:Uncharacterized protein n=1 Tax=Enemella dayhoffiae TaxID=2016507 RepID=A0A255H778_9ACTN|nr:hypothetical protein [Enemella dayhoffiae]NNG21101.1 hypothetical protein [Naumannella sp. ID2617S]OYO23525.1 hypothetical protein CGZ93_06225 [Enemella dayhoffiae]